MYRCINYIEFTVAAALCRKFLGKSLFRHTCMYVFANHLVAKWVRALAPQAEGWVFESQPRQPKVVKTGTCSDSSIAKRIAMGVSVTSSRRWPL